MTLLGFWLEADHGWIWSDTEFYHRLDEDQDDERHLCGRPLGHHLKIAINRRGFAAVGAGDAGGNSDIGQATEFADLFDHLCGGLPVFQRVIAYRSV